MILFLFFIAPSFSSGTLTTFYKDRVFYPQAQPWLEKGKEIGEKRLDQDNLYLANIYNNLANLYYSQGKYSEAEPFYKQALDICEQKLDGEHPLTQTVQKNLELCRQQQQS